jgi:pimeloyl-ACP methyl ester carboxylesterase
VWLTDEGEGPLVIAVPGLPGTHRDFRWLAPEISAWARIVRLDMPGFGHTPLRRGVRPHPAWRGDLIADVADALEHETFSVITHSMSGPALASLAARRPRRIQAAAFLACGGTRPHRLWRRMPLSPPLVSGLFAAPRRRRVLLPAARLAYRMLGFGRPDDQAITTAIHCVAATDFAAMRRDLQHMLAPTLVAHADDDPLIEPTLADEIGTLAPAGPRLRFAEGGHGIIATQAVEIAAALRPLVRNRIRASNRPDKDRRPATRASTPG